MGGFVSGFVGFRLLIDGFIRFGLGVGRFVGFRLVSGFVEIGFVVGFVGLRLLIDGFIRFGLGVSGFVRFRLNVSGFVGFGFDVSGFVGFGFDVGGFVGFGFDVGGFVRFGFVVGLVAGLVTGFVVVVGFVEDAGRSVRFKVDRERLDGRRVRLGFGVNGFVGFVGRFVSLQVVHGRLLGHGVGFVSGGVGFLRAEVVGRFVGFGRVESGRRRVRRVARLKVVVKIDRVGIVVAAAAALPAVGLEERIEGVVAIDDAVDGRLADVLGEDRIGSGQTRGQRRGQHQAHQLALHLATPMKKKHHLQSRFQLCQPAWIMSTSFSHFVSHSFDAESVAIRNKFFSETKRETRPTI